MVLLAVVAAVFAGAKEVEEMGRLELTSVAEVMRLPLKTFIH